MRAGFILLVLLSMGQASEPPSISGRVLDPDGKPVTAGTVALLTTVNTRVTAAIDKLGEFRIVPDAVQRQSLFISVPNLAPYRAFVNLPSSRRMHLPDIPLAKATHFAVRFVTPEGEPLGGSIRRRSIDADGASIPDPLDHTRERADGSGGVIIGPLPPGRSLLAFNRDGWAQTRLRDAVVNGSQPLIDGGTVSRRAWTNAVADRPERCDALAPHGHDSVFAGRLRCANRRGRTRDGVTVSTGAGRSAHSVDQLHLHHARHDFRARS